MSGPVAQRENHVNFYNRYLLLLEDEYTDEQAGREHAVTDEVLWALKWAITLGLGAPNECQQNSGHSRLGHQSSLRR
jgi:hypothetical protein